MEDSGLVVRDMPAGAGEEKQIAILGLIPALPRVCGMGKVQPRAFVATMCCAQRLPLGP